MTTPRHPRFTRRYRNLPQRPPSPADAPIPTPAAAARPRAASWLGRLLRRHPPVNRPTLAELADLTPKERQELWDAHRQRPFQAITSLITSVTVILGILFTARTLDYTAGTLDYTARALGTTQEGQITDRYTKAAEQLAHNAVDVRLAAIYSLQRLANDSPRDRPTIKNVLAAFVRNHDLCTPTPPPPQCALKRKSSTTETIRLPTDVYAALTIAPTLTNPPPATNDTNTQTDRSDFSNTRFPYGDLRNVNLRNADLASADLRSAWLHDADLTGADLNHADLTDAYLRGAHLRGADLASANLNEANLTYTDLNEANLIYAEMNEADLTFADLNEADLTYVVLSYANLRDADLTGANLRDANLTDADLTGANLHRADLRDADLTGANLTYANLTGADLNRVRGMSPDEIRAAAKTDVNTDF
ncbi:hypothetical protein HerbRD11066_00010 [Herbidospora sp. RD11066]